MKINRLIFLYIFSLNSSAFSAQEQDAQDCQIVRDEVDKICEAWNQLTWRPLHAGMESRSRTTLQLKALLMKKCNANSRDKHFQKVDQFGEIFKIVSDFEKEQQFLKNEHKRRAEEADARKQRFEQLMKSNMD